MSKEYLSIDQCVAIYDVEASFLQELSHNGLILLESHEGNTALPYDQLATLERFRSWHYDLEVNMEGLEMMHKMLGLITELRNENYRLANRLRFFDGDNSGNIFSEG